MAIPVPYDQPRQDLHGQAGAHLYQGQALHLLHRVGTLVVANYIIQVVQRVQIVPMGNRIYPLFSPFPLS